MLFRSWITQYPSYTNITDIRDFVKGIKVPILMLAGEADSYLGCCLIGTARSMAAAAKQFGVPLELVSYSGINHAFNLGFLSHNDAATADAWRRTVIRLAQYLSE